MWLTTLPSVATPRLKNALLRSNGTRNANWPKGDCAVASNASVVRHIVFRPLFACAVRHLRSKIDTVGLHELFHYPIRKGVEVGNLDRLGRADATI